MWLRAFILCALGTTLHCPIAAGAQQSDVARMPSGWSVSDTIGTLYRTGYDDKEGAAYLESIGSVGEVGAFFNEQSVQAGANAREGKLREIGRVPYSKEGQASSDLWAGEVAQAVKGATYMHRHVTFKAEIKKVNFTGQFLVFVRYSNGNRQHGSFFGGERSSPPDTWLSVDGNIDTLDLADNDADQAVLSYGFAIQGTGRVLIRNVKLEVDAMTPYSTRVHVPLDQVFAPPPTLNEAPTNLALHP